MTALNIFISGLISGIIIYQSFVVASTDFKSLKEKLFKPSGIKNLLTLFKKNHAKCIKNFIYNVIYYTLKD